MVDVFSEVDEDLRHEKLKAMGKKFGPYVVGLIVLFIGGMGGQVYWEDHVKEARIAESERYHAAMTQLADGNSPAAMTGFEALIADAEYGYDLLARLQVASNHAAEGRFVEALGAYDTIAADGDVEDRFRDFANLMAAGILLDQNAGQEVYDRLLPLTEETGGWHYSAKEMVGLAHFREGHWQAAEDIFSVLVLDTNTPQELRNRAQEFLEMIEAVKPAEDLFDLGQDNETLADEEENVPNGDEPETDE